MLGETGVGKEVIATAIHDLSARKNEPFIKVNCGAITDSLIDSELFGHEKGAFTGATSQKRGKFERADGGTLFLDEIGEMPFPVQSRLLRVLQTGEFERVGGINPIKVDVRLIAATHKDLETLAKKGVFREDLWHRLNVFPITIPPLRKRTMDIPSLIHYFIHKKQAALNLNLSPKIESNTVDSLKSYHWPGNIRELENAVERELIRCQANKNHELKFSDITMNHAFPKQQPKKQDSNQPLPTQLDDVIRLHIIETLEKTGGKIQGSDGAAKLLGLHPSTLRHRLRKLGISFGRVKENY